MKPRSQLKDKSAAGDQSKLPELPTRKDKPYAFKYRVLKIRCGEIFDQWDTPNYDLSA